MTSQRELLELQNLLDSAREREKRAIVALAPKHKGGEMEEWLAASESVLSAERAIARALGEEFAVPINFPVQWDSGAPLPYLLQSEYKTYLVFFLQESDPNWNGTFTTVRHPDSSETSKIALVEFKQCISAKLGSPNDEVLNGHPLSGRGFQGDRPMIVNNSNWAKELQTINSVHNQYRPERWNGIQHFIFGFHDSTFECVAGSFAVEVFEATLPFVLAEVCKRLLQ